MGLFEARQLALELNGTVALEARAAGGTVARVTVPIELPDEP
jgi:signal transduction histidine kinase